MLRIHASTLRQGHHRLRNRGRSTEVGDPRGHLRSFRKRATDQDVKRPLRATFRTGPSTTSWQHVL